MDLSYLLQIVTGAFPYNQSFSQALQNVWSLFSPNLLAQALKLLSDATSTPEDVGVSWSRRTKCAPNDEECVITIVCLQFKIENLLLRMFHIISSIYPLVPLLFLSSLYSFLQAANFHNLFG